MTSSPEPHQASGLVARGVTLVVPAYNEEDGIEGFLLGR